ncbi:MAG: tRNA preQ1(34) S-adenosylmethionine ribosyltransferase-isomerase QueA [Mogibacterium sp.]|nr:tRNA preQ1(34) S-adenosylmethionine ribosyltransferase-isomerase QueA [Mogibacterium sp.]
MKLSDFDYNLPEELIAQTPSEQRDACRMMVVHRGTGEIEHRCFHDITEYLRPGDCLVVNDSRVIPARMFGTKESTGARIELLLIRRIEGDCWESMVRPGKRLKEGDTVIFDTERLFRAHIQGYADPENGTRVIRFEYEGIFMERLEELGRMPLPPYITREAEDSDKEMYQTVYSRVDGSVAAPTAGLHFTRELMDQIRAMGIHIASVTLHVGIGTFRPVKTETIEEHKMHFEEYSIDEENAAVINEAIASGNRVIAVGTTSVRTLESAAVMTEEGYRIPAGHSSTGIFIYPGYTFKVTDALITNFHLPKSTLLMLISALYDREKILEAYEEAVREPYRFFSYGDCMFIE